MEDHYVLLGHWQQLEDHTVGFRQSPQYQEWRRLLHHFYDPFPSVLHYGPLFKRRPQNLILPGRRVKTKQFRIS